MRSLKLSKYNYYVDLKDDKLVIFNTITQAIQPFSKSLFSMKGKSISLLADENNIPPAMFANGFVLDSDINELDYVINNYNSRILCFNKKHLAITLLPTLKCNFSCSYCYEEFSEDGKTIRTDMTEETFAQVYSFISNESNRLDTFHVNLYGGEPLIDIKKAKEIINNIYNICNENNCEFSLAIISNGYNLTKEIIDLLIMKNIKTFIQVTLDGSRELHDSKRFLSNGEKTFDVIINNLKYLVEVNKNDLFNISTRVNLREGEEEAIFKLCDQLHSESILTQTHLHPAMIFDMQSPNCNDTKSQIIKTELQKKMCKHITKITGQESLPPNYTFVRKSLCAMQMRNSLVINPKGDLFKCYMEINNPSRCIGHISQLYRIRGNKTNIEIANRSKIDLDMCRECPSLPICVFHCPWDTLEDGTCHNYSRLIKDDISDYLDER
jgi:uncharacterized protein